MIRFKLTLLIFLLIVNIASGKITVLPTPGKIAAVAMSDVPGRLIVVKASPYKVVRVTTYTDDSGSIACMWEGESGLYGVLLVPYDRSLPMDTVEVVLGRDPLPPPDPVDPDDPDIVVPDGYLGLTKLAYVTATSDGKLPKTLEVAQCYGEVAKSLTKYPPEYAMLTQAFDDLKNKIAKKLTESEQTTWSNFSDKLESKLDSLWKFDRDEAAKILAAIADGLNYVDKK